MQRRVNAQDILKDSADRLPKEATNKNVGATPVPTFHVVVN